MTLFEGAEVEAADGLIASYGNAVWLSKMERSLSMYEFVESPVFERVICDYLDDEGYSALQAALSQWPEAGDLIRARADAGSCDGICQARASVVAFALSTTSSCAMDASGYWLFTARACKRMFLRMSSRL